MQKSETVTALATALAKAQAIIGVAVKDSTNPHFKSKYADLGSVWAACRKPLTDNGLSVVQMPVDAEPGRVALTTILMHSSGEYIGSTVSTKLGKDDAQGVGSALTYLRRYSLAAMVGIVADEDDDGNAASAAPKSNGNGAQYQAPASEPFDRVNAINSIRKHAKYVDEDETAIEECKTRADFVALHKKIAAR